LTISKPIKVHLHDRQRSDFKVLIWAGKQPIKADLDFDFCDRNRPPIRFQPSEIGDQSDFSR